MKKTKNKLERFLIRLVDLNRFQIFILVMFILVVVPLLYKIIATHLFYMPDVWAFEKIANGLIVGILVGLMINFIMILIVKELKESRQRLANVITELKAAHHRDIDLTIRLEKNINTLNQEIFTRKDAEKELHQKAALLRAYMNLSPDIIYLRDENNCFSWCNNSMALLLGIDAKQIIGLTPDDLYSKDMVKDIIASDEKALRYNTTVTQELWFTYPNGHRAFFEIKTMPFYDEKTNERKGIISFGRDITEHNQNKLLLEKENREKMTFISVISHEVRTALNAIIGLSRMLLDSKLDSSQKEYQETIYTSAIMLNVIFNDIIEINRLELNKIDIDRRATAKSSFIANLTNITSIMVKQKSLKLTVDVDDSCPPYLMIDETRFNQILWNIIHNAVKFTPKGKIHLHAWYDKKRAILYFSICDTGIGIPKKELSRIFTMYYRVKNDTNTPGTGIGLAVSKAIAKAMQGDIIVDSEEGQGSCFTIMIYAPYAEPPINEYQLDPFISLHILLVEDIELNVVVAKSVLEKLGHVIHVARSGSEALTLFKPNTYDLVLLDIQLPDFSGLDVTRKLHESYEKEDIPPIIAFTANAQPDRQIFLEAGIADFITKPLSISAFNAIVDHFWPAPEKSKEEHQSNPRSLHFLLVEDVELNIIIAKSLLTRLGHTVDVAKEGNEALDMFKLHVYDIVLLDIQLPDITGFEIIKTLLNQYKKEELPKFIAITANIALNKQEYLNAGFDGIIEKPIMLKELKSIIYQVCPTSKEKKKTITQQSSYLNLKSLQQYIELVGQDVLLQSVGMLEEIMPSYIDNLLTYHTAENEKSVHEEAHKIKGAVGSLGLIRLQGIARQLQDISQPFWYENAGSWIEEIKSGWQHDVEILKQWIDENSR